MNETKLTCFNFVVKKGLRWLRWLENLESYVEMVAGLPRIQINDQELLRANELTESLNC